MCLCTLCTERFVGRVGGSGVWRAYCRARRVTPLILPRGCPPGEASQAWLEALARLPEEARERVSWEQDAVNELAGRQGVAHLLAAAGGALPPADTPGGGPLALWFLLRQPELFRDVFYRHRHREPDVWHALRVPAGRAQAGDPAALAGRLSEWSRRRNGSRGPWRAAAHRLPSAVCLAASGPGRPERPDGADATRRTGPATLRVQLLHYPGDGTVLLQGPPAPPDRAREDIVELAAGLLGVGPAPRPAFALDQLRHPFFPPTGEDGIEFVGVRTLNLRYPGRAGGRGLLLQCLSACPTGGMAGMLDRHVRPGDLEDLTVGHAELVVRVPLGPRAREQIVRLWPDRCDLGPGEAGDRVLSCLRRWGL